MSKVYLSSNQWVCISVESANLSVFENVWFKKITIKSIIGQCCCFSCSKSGWVSKGCDWLWLVTLFLQIN